MRFRGTAGERGFTLVEVMIVSSLFLVVLSATLGAMTTFEHNSRDNEQLNEQVDRARHGMERTMRQLRNLAQPQTSGISTISRAAAHDFIFQTSDPSRTWVRYCLETRADGAVFLRGMTSTSAVITAGMAGTCPGSGWTRSDIVSENVTNTRISGRDIPLFTYSCVVGAPAACPAGSADYPKITGVGMDILVDDNLASAPPEVRIASGVFLRNQNEAPTAAFSSRATGQPRQVLLNGSASSDPEGRTLRYYWFRAPGPAFACSETPPSSALLGGSITLTYTFPAGDGSAGASKNFELVVCDPGGTQARVTNAVTIPN